MIIQVIPSTLCFSGFLAVSYRFPWCFGMLLPLFPRFLSLLFLFPCSVYHASYLRFCSFLVYLSLKVYIRNYKTINFIDFLCDFFKNKMSTHLNIINYRRVLTVFIPNFYLPPTLYPFPHLLAIFFQLIAKLSKL